MWNSTNGLPLYNALAWCDTRAKAVLDDVLNEKRIKVDYVRAITGLPLSCCCSALKVKWLMENIKEVKEAISKDICMFGTLDSWVLWNLSGGEEGGVHVTDPSNACRTMLMNLNTLAWDDRLCDFFNVPKKILPKIQSCSEIYGHINAGLLTGVPICAMMNDNVAAFFGQVCHDSGTVMCDYEEGCSLYFNTGQEVIKSLHGLTSTVVFKLGPNANTFYALEGSVPNAGSAITWLRDTLNVPTKISGTTALEHRYGETKKISPTYISAPINDSNNDHLLPHPADPNLVFVPALTGFDCSLWKQNERGLLSGLTLQTRPEQVVYATFEAIAFQTRQFLEALARDYSTWQHPIKRIRVVGETVVDTNTLLQLVADLCGVIVEKSQAVSPSPLGIMLAASLAIKAITLDYYREHCFPPIALFQPYLNDVQRDTKFFKWLQAVEKSNFMESSTLTAIQWDDGREEDTPKTVFDRYTTNDSTTTSHSIPGTFYLFSSFTLLLLADFLSGQTTLP